MAEVNPIAHDITNSRVPTRLCDGKPAESHEVPALDIGIPAAAVDERFVRNLTRTDTSAERRRTGETSPQRRRMRLL